MNINLVLELLVDYYRGTRGIGHTLTMIHGAVSTPGVAIVAIGRAHGEMVIEANQLLSTRETDALKSAQVIGLPELVKLRNCTPAPLAFDNGALCFLFDQAAARISHLEAENDLLHAELLRRM